METIEKREKIHELVKEQQLEKKEQATYDIDTIKMNAQNLIKFSQIQLAQTLKELAASEDEIIHEMNEYWMKELPIHKPVLSYIKAAAALINIYTQQEDLYKRTLDEIYTSVDFPEWNKVEATYLETIDSLKQQLEMMKKEFFKLKKDMTEEFEQQKEQFEDARKKELEKLNVSQKNEIARVHLEYSTTFHEAEKELSELEKANSALKSQVETLLAEVATLKEENKKIYSANSGVQQFSKTQEGSSVANLPHRSATPPILSPTAQNAAVLASDDDVAQKKEVEEEEKEIDLSKINPNYLKKDGTMREYLMPLNLGKLQKDIKKMYLSLVGEHMTRLGIRKRIVRFHSPKTIQRYYDEMIQDGWIELLENEMIVMHPEKIPPDYFTKKEWDEILKKGDTKDAKKE